MFSKPTGFTITLAEFDVYVTELAKHDWFYSYSDDFQVYKRGEAKQKELLEKAKQHNAYRRAFSIWNAYENGGTADKTRAKAHRDRDIAAIRNELGAD